MQTKQQQDFIDNIVQSAKTSEFSQDIYDLVHIIEDRDQQIKKLKKENSFFLKQWDKRNLLADKRDATKDKIIEQQSRLAAMGEMIDAIAHQWKQPLNAISMMLDMLKSDFKDGNVDSTYINQLETASHMQINHMVTTLGEFRNFLRPSTKNEYFLINSVVANVLVLMKDELIAQNINIHTNFDHEVEIFGNKNEFKHLFLNLFSNSIDAYNETNIQKRSIYVTTYNEKNKTYIEVEDNAGGIPDNIINDIFKPNITTKKEGKGTGIGLYMTKQIVKKNNGSINVHNSKKGAFFTIILPFVNN